MITWLFQECYARSKYQEPGQVITPYSFYAKLIFVPALDTDPFKKAPDLL